MSNIDAALILLHVALVAAVAGFYEVVVIPSRIEVAKAQAYLDATARLRAIKDEVTERMNTRASE